MTEKPPALSGIDRTNFSALLFAAKNGRLSLLSVIDRKTGEARAMVCAMIDNGDSWQVHPVALMVDRSTVFDDYSPGNDFPTRFRPT